MPPFILRKYGITRRLPSTIMNRDACSLKVDLGTCQNFVRKWFFDPGTGGCVAFLYGGCGGNGNRFNSEAECLNACMEPGNEV